MRIEPVQRPADRPVVIVLCIPDSIGIEIIKSVRQTTIYSKSLVYYVSHAVDHGTGSGPGTLMGLRIWNKKSPVTIEIATMSKCQDPDHYLIVLLYIRNEATEPNL